MSPWYRYDSDLARIMAQMMGAADYFDEHPEWASDANVAAAFREYVARARAVEVPV